MSRHIVAAVEDIPPGQRRIVTVAGREVGIFNVGGRFYAVRNRCPHQAGPLCTGQQLSFLTSSAPGEYKLERDGEMLRCPWHQWEFDLRTGQSWFDPARVRVRAYEARVEAGAALRASADGDGTSDVAMNSNRPAGMEPGPYTAEVYPVSVERAYVVVEIGRGR